MYSILMNSQEKNGLNHHIVIRTIDKLWLSN